MKRITSQDGININKDRSNGIIVGDGIIVQHSQFKRFILQIRVLGYFKAEVFIPGRKLGLSAYLGPEIFKISESKLYKGISQVALAHHISSSDNLYFEDARHENARIASF